VSTFDDRFAQIVMDYEDSAGCGFAALFAQAEVELRAEKDSFNVCEIGTRAWLRLPADEQAAGFQSLFYAYWVLQVQERASLALVDAMQAGAAVPVSAHLRMVQDSIEAGPDADGYVDVNWESLHAVAQELRVHEHRLDALRDAVREVPAGGHAPVRSGLGARIARLIAAAVNYRTRGEC
jgi:hypothetical protein